MLQNAVRFLIAKVAIEQSLFFKCLVIYNCFYINSGGHAVAQLVEALRYKPEDRGFESR
jgi:hypothetical protein